MQNLPWWAAVLLAVFTSGFGAAFLAFMQFLIKRYDKQRMGSAFPKTAEVGREIGTIITELMHATKADQVLVLECRNGGKVIQPGAILKSSVYREVFSEKANSVMDRWNKQLLDAYYIGMLDSVFQQGPLMLATDELPPCNLKNIYITQGIQRSHMSAIRTENGVLFYLSVTWQTPTLLENAIVEDHTRVARQKIQKQLRLRKTKGLDHP
jgi:hypothetical protein